MTIKVLESKVIKTAILKMLLLFVIMATLQLGTNTFFLIKHKILTNNLLFKLF